MFVRINMVEVFDDLMKWQSDIKCDGCGTRVIDHHEIKSECSEFFLALLKNVKRQDLINSKANITQVQLYFYFL